MVIKVGSQNPAKLEAVREILQDYAHLADAVIKGVEVSSGVSEQPLSLEEITAGAANRAREAFLDCEYSIGLEAGFMKVPHAKSGYMNVSACAIYDGTTLHLGLSSAFETPDTEVMRLVAEDGMNLAEAANKTGLVSDPEVGKRGGIISTLTKGKIDRKEFVKQSLRMALVHIEKHD